MEPDRRQAGVVVLHRLLLVARPHPQRGVDEGFQPAFLSAGTSLPRGGSLVADVATQFPRVRLRHRTRMRHRLAGGRIELLVGRRLDQRDRIRRPGGPQAYGALQQRGVHQQRVEVARLDLERPSDRGHRRVEIVPLTPQSREVEPRARVARSQRDQGLEARLGGGEIPGGERLADLLVDGRDIGSGSRLGHAGRSAGWARGGERYTSTPGQPKEL